MNGDDKPSLRTPLPAEFEDQLRRMMIRLAAEGHTALTVAVMISEMRRAERWCREQGTTLSQVTAEQVRGYLAAHTTRRIAALRAFWRLTARSDAPSAADLRTVKPVPPRGAFTLDPYVERFTKRRIAVGEVSRATGHTQRFSLWQFAETFGNRPVQRLSKSDVERWLETIARQTPATRRKKLSEVRIFCRWLVTEKHIQRDPTVGIRAPRQPKAAPRVLDHDSCVKLVQSLPDARARLIVLLDLQLGLRCIEVSRLELGDISADGWVRVRGKGGHERVLPLLPEVRAALESYLDERGRRSGPLIENYQYPGKGLAAHTISQLVREWIQEAGIKQGPHDGRSAHGLRRTAATDMFETGADIIDVAEALGHQNLASVRHYAKYRTERLRTAMGGRVYSPETLVAGRSYRGVGRNLVSPNSWVSSSDTTSSSS